MTTGRLPVRSVKPRPQNQRVVAIHAHDEPSCVDVTGCNASERRRACRRHQCISRRLPAIWIEQSAQAVRLATGIQVVVGRDGMDGPSGTWKGGGATGRASKKIRADRRRRGRAIGRSCRCSRPRAALDRTGPGVVRTKAIESRDECCAGQRRGCERPSCGECVLARDAPSRSRCPRDGFHRR